MKEGSYLQKYSIWGEFLWTLWVKQPLPGNHQIFITLYFLFITQHMGLKAFSLKKTKKSFQSCNEIFQFWFIVWFRRVFLHQPRPKLANQKLVTKITGKMSSGRQPSIVSWKKWWVPLLHRKHLYSLTTYTPILEPFTKQLFLLFVWLKSQYNLDKALLIRFNYSF